MAVNGISLDRRRPGCHRRRAQQRLIAPDMVALEEAGLAHILNALGEKIQKAIQHSRRLDDLLEINKSTNRTLRKLIKKEMLLQFKLEELVDLIKNGKKKGDWPEEETA